MRFINSNSIALWKYELGLTLNGPWYDFVPVSFCKLQKPPAGRMVKKTVEQNFQTILQSIARFFREY